jgi:hypothetical protein
MTLPAALAGNPKPSSTLYSVTTWALAQADPSLPTPPAASNVFTFPQVADVLPAYNVMPVTRAGVPLPVVTPPLAVPGRPRSGGVLAATGLPVSSGLAAVALLLASLVAGSLAVRLRRSGLDA